MKQDIDITLRTIHVGDCRRVVTLNIDGKDEAREFLENLRHDDAKKWHGINTRITTVSNYPTYSNKITFNHVGDGVFEFKRPGLRLYAFYDTIGDEHHLILCTNGGTKNTQKQQQADIRRAKKIKVRYEAAIKDPDTRITLRKQKHED